MPKWQEFDENNIIWISIEELTARHNLSIVEPYNRINSEEIREINQELTRWWEKLNNQRENLPINKRKLLAKIERRSREKLTVEGEEITIFTELKELILLNANDETEKIIQQARQNFRQIKINWILYEEKYKLIWWLSQLLGEEKPTVLEKKSTGNEEELKPPQLDEVIEDEQEDEEQEQQEKPEKDKDDKKNISEPNLIKAVAEEPAETKNGSLLEAKKLAQEKIKQLLKKNALANESLPLEYQNWQEEIEKLNSQQDINQFLQQMEAAIAQKAQNLNQTAASPKVNNNWHLLLLGLGAIGLSLGGLIILLISLRKKKN